MGLLVGGGWVGLGCYWDWGDYYSGVNDAPDPATSSDSNVAYFYAYFLSSTLSTLPSCYLLPPFTVDATYAFSTLVLYLLFDSLVLSILELPLFVFVAVTLVDEVFLLGLVLLACTSRLTISDFSS